MPENPVTPERSCPARRGVFASLALHGLLWANLVAVTTLVVPRFEHEFNDMGLALPGVTEKALAASHWFQHYWHVIAILSVPALSVEGGLLLLLGRWSATRGLGRCWSVAMTTLLAIGAVFVAFSVLLSWAKLHSELSR